MTTYETLLSVVQQNVEACLLADNVTPVPFWSGLAFQQNIDTDDAILPLAYLARPVNPTINLHQSGNSSDTYDVTILFLGGKTEIDDVQSLHDPLLVIAYNLVTQFIHKVLNDSRVDNLTSPRAKEIYYVNDRTMTGFELTCTIQITATASVCT